MATIVRQGQERQRSGASNNLYIVRIRGWPAVLVWPIIPPGRPYLHDPPSTEGAFKRSGLAQLRGCGPPKAISLEAPGLHK